MAAEVGSKAPDCTLANESFEPIRLAEQFIRRTTVLAFFPAAFSGTCTKELCTFRDSLAQLNQVNAQIFGISVDTPFALKAFAEQQRLGFPLLSDFNKEAIQLYGVYNQDMIGLKGIAKRAVFVVDRKGITRYREVLDDARHEPDYGKVKQAVAALEQPVGSRR